MSNYLQVKKNVLTPRVLSTKEHEEISGVIYSYLHDPQTSFDLAKTWHSFFLQKNFDSKIVSDLFDTFWEWYAIATFENFNKHSTEEMLLIIPNLFMMAFRLGYNVPLLYIDYHMGYIPEDQDQNDLHRAISQRVLAMTSPFDYKKGMPISQLIKNIQQRDRVGSLEISGIMGSLENFLFPSESEISNPHSSEKKQEKVNKVLDFLIFIADPGSIDYARQAYVDHAPHLSSSLFSDITFNEIDQKDIEKLEALEAAKMLQKNVVTSIPQKSKIFSFAALKKQIIKDAQARSLEKDSDEYMAFVFDELQKNSDKEQNPHILDLYYYDEQMEKFVWNDELLTSL